MKIKPVSLEEVMLSREKRALNISSLLKRFGLPVVSMTMNMIGDLKVTPASRAAFIVMYERLRNQLSPVDAKLELKSTGDEALFVVKMPAEKVKSLTCSIENEKHIGRVLDLDVFSESGEKLSRETPRLCLVCGNTALACSRSRAHGVEAVRQAAYERIYLFLSEHIAHMACDALMEEVDASPKPGLVDRLNNGAHKDMDLKLFYKSANSLYDYFRKLTYFTMSHPDESLKDLMSELRLMGIEAEKAMLLATNGINTHKGAIFTLGLLSAALALKLSRTAMDETVTNIAGKLINSEHSEPFKDSGTHGARVEERYGKAGARGEAHDGFPTTAFAKSRLDDYIDSQALDRNTAAILTLLDVMAVLDDTNVLHRRGLDGLSIMKNAAKDISALPLHERIEKAVALDKLFIDENISPGGCADILSAAIFLRKADSIITVSGYYKN